MTSQQRYNSVQNYTGTETQHPERSTRPPLRGQVVRSQQRADAQHAHEREAHRDDEEPREPGEEWAVVRERGANRRRRRSECHEDCGEAHHEHDRLADDPGRLTGRTCLQVVHG
jgi:hypothetical protein